MLVSLAGPPPPLPSKPRAADDSLPLETYADVKVALLRGKQLPEVLARHGLEMTLRVHPVPGGEGRRAVGFATFADGSEENITLFCEFHSVSHKIQQDLREAARAVKEGRTATLPV
jgi:hypothetical protein